MGASQFRRMTPPPSALPLSKGRMGGVAMAKVRCTQCVGFRDVHPIYGLTNHFRYDKTK